MQVKHFNCVFIYMLIMFLMYMIKNWKTCIAIQVHVFCKSLAVSLRKSKFHVWKLFWLTHTKTKYLYLEKTITFHLLKSAQRTLNSSNPNFPDRSPLTVLRKKHKTPAQKNQSPSRPGFELMTSAVIGQCTNHSAN